MWQTKTVRPTSDSAQRVRFESVIPIDKGEKELFWVKALLQKLEWKAVKEVRCNADDSHGQHDVIVDLQDGSACGVHVTELTFEFTRCRESIRKRYINEVFKLLAKENVQFDRKITVVALFPDSETDPNKQLSPTEVVEAIQTLRASNSSEVKVKDCVFTARLLPAGHQFTYPNNANIGFDVDFDLVPRSVKSYQEAIQLISDKKSDSKSPILLIWSSQFWRDRHKFGSEVLKFMKKEFSCSGFEAVYFIESMVGEGLFSVNLHLDVVK